MPLKDARRLRCRCGQMFSQSKPGQASCWRCLKPIASPPAKPHQVEMTPEEHARLDREAHFHKWLIAEFERLATLGDPALNPVICRLLSRDNTKDSA